MQMRRRERLRVRSKVSRPRSGPSNR